MPNSDNWIFSYTPETSASSSTFAVSHVPLTAAQIEQEYEEHRRERERQDCIYEMQMQMWKEEAEEQRQLIEDKKRYPLFFLKEGIV